MGKLKGKFRNFVGGEDGISLEEEIFPNGSEDRNFPDTRKTILHDPSLS